MTEWIDEDYRSWRWIKRFAWYPVNTFDKGWIFMCPYWRWQSVWGWGFSDDWPYVECKCPGCRDNLPWVKGYHSVPPDGMMKCNS